MCHRRITLSTVALAAAWSCSSLPGARADNYLNGEIDGFFEFSVKQLTALAEEILPSPDVFTDYTDTNGSWIILDGDGEYEDNGVWTSGMVCGQYWYLYSYTGDEYWQTTADSCTAAMNGTQYADDNDVGFQVFNSYGLGYKLTGNADYKEQVLTGAQNLYDIRYDERIPAYWSWANPSRRPDWDRAVNVDMMMNMEIMLWSAQNGGDETWIDAAEGHADTTWKDIVRDDNSTYHVADYDNSTGELVDQGTYQGAFDESTWSRGQAWAVYGNVMMHRFIPDGPYLDYAKGLLQYFDDNNDEDKIPPADFEAERNASNPEDSSSTVIVASALFEMFQMTGDPAHLELAVLYLTSALQPTYYEPDADDGWQSILRRASSEHDSPEVGAVFGDYFCIESMVRYVAMAPSILLREATADVAYISDRDFQLDDGYDTMVTGATFTADDLVDTDFSRMSASSDVSVWYGITLTRADTVPTAFEIEGEEVTCTATMSTPVDGWTVGENTGVLSFEAESFECFAGITEVVGTSIWFSEVDGADFFSYDFDFVDEVTINYLIVGHPLEL